MKKKEVGERADAEKDEWTEGRWRRVEHKQEKGFYTSAVDVAVPVRKVLIFSSNARPWYGILSELVYSYGVRAGCSNSDGAISMPI